jgi:hypothetical protein
LGKDVCCEWRGEHGAQFDDSAAGQGRTLHGFLENGDLKEPFNI